MTGVPKVHGMRVEELDGATAVVFLATDARGQEIKLAVPASGWDAIFGEGRRRLDAAFNQAHQASPQQWSKSLYRDGLPVQLGSTDDGKVLLIACHGLPTEVSLAFDRQSALALAEGLVEMADSLPSPLKAS